MARRGADRDERQADFFGISARPPVASAPAQPGPPQPDSPKPRPSKRSPARGHEPEPPAEPPPPPPPSPPPPAAPAPPAADGLDALGTRLSPAELGELAAALPDDALATLALAAVRQLRRRLVRGRGRKGSASPLERAARQLAAELGGSASGDDA